MLYVSRQHALGTWGGELNLEPSRSHPPLLYYLPAVLTPSQKAFIAKRKAEVIIVSLLCYYNINRVWSLRWLKLLRRSGVLSLASAILQLTRFRNSGGECSKRRLASRWSNSFEDVLPPQKNLRCSGISFPLSGTSYMYISCWFGQLCDAIAPWLWLRPMRAWQEAPLKHPQGRRQAHIGQTVFRASHYRNMANFLPCSIRSYHPSSLSHVYLITMPIHIIDSLLTLYASNVSSSHSMSSEQWRGWTVGATPFASA